MWRYSRPAGLATTLIVLLLHPAAAEADRAFAQRFSQNITGDVTIVGNTLMTCSGFFCPAAQAGSDTVPRTNNDYSMVPVDVDGFGGGSNSSRANLNLPTGATVLFAGLYWGARSTSLDRNRILFDTPATSTYQSLTASVLDSRPFPDTEYQGFRDVTGLVQAGGNGTYTAGGVRLTTGTDGYAGWALVVAYRDPAQPARSLAVFDGFTEVSATNDNVPVRLSGFKAPSFGPVRTALGAVAYEGDRGSLDDQLRLGSTVLSNAVNPSNDFFNSTISRNAAHVTAKQPNYVNQLGFDADVVDASNLLPNGATQATITLSTGFESYLPGVVTFSTELFAPQLTSSKVGTDLNGGLLEQGDVVEYTITGRNTGQDAAVNLRMTDAIPAGTSYVPGSLVMDAGGPAPAGPRTDAAGDDSAEFSAAQNRVVFRLGTGANATSGGELIPTAAVTVRFRVRINPSLPPGAGLTNVATFEFNGKDTGDPFLGATPPPAAPTPISSPDFALAKTHAGDTVRGGTLSYRLVATNVGDAPQQGTVTVSDTLPTGLTTTAAPSGAGWTCSQAGQTITCTRSDPLGPGASYPEISVPVRVAQNAPATLANAASVRGAGDGNPRNDSVADPLSVVSSSDLRVTKTASAATAGVGDTVTFTLSVTNDGPTDATSATLADPLPAGLQLVSAPGCTETVTCDLGALASGASQTRTITARVTAEAAGRTVTNTATVHADPADPDPADNSATSTLTVRPEADVRLTKAIQPDPLVAGGPVRFTLTARNTGPSPATALVVEDPLPAQVRGPVTITSDPPGASCTLTLETVRCTFASLAAGQQASVEIAGTLDPASGGSTLANTATATAAEHDPVPADNSAGASALISAVADLAVTKADSADPVRAGEELRYTIIVTNRGPSTAPATHLVDAIPSALTVVSTTPACDLAGGDLDCSLGDVPAGQSRTVTVVTRVAPTFTGTLENSARAFSAAPDSTPNAAVDTETTDVVGAADLELSKSDSPDPVAAGDVLTYTLTLRNAGPSTAADARIQDVLAPSLVPLAVDPPTDCTLSNRTVNCALGAMDPGAERTVTISGRVLTGALGTLSNTAAATSDTADPDGSDNTSTADTTIAPAADLVLTKQDRADPVAGGSAVVYDLELTNLGPSNASAVTIADAVPPEVAPTTVSPSPDCSLSGQDVRCTLGDLAPGQRRTVRIEGVVAPGFTGTIGNTATVDSGTPDRDPASNRATASTTVFASADVRIEKTQTPNPVTPGGEVTYTLAVENNGPSIATGVVVHDPVPADVTIAGVDPVPACTRVVQDVTCAFGTLAPGDRRTVTISGTVAPAHVGALTNLADVTSSTLDPVPGNNQDVSQSDADASADLAVVKLDTPDPVRAGELLRYEITVTNNGPSNALDVDVDDLLPPELAFESGEPRGTCSRSGQAIHCEERTLGPGETRTGFIVARVDPGFAGGSIHNTITIRSDTPDSDAANNTFTADTTVLQDADLSIRKVDDPDPVRAGERLEYTLTVDNSGPSTARAVSLVDVLPAGLLVSDVDPVAGCRRADAQLLCDLGDLAPGASRTVRVSGLVDETFSGALENTASVASDTPDSDLADNSASASTTVNAFAALELTKVDSPDPARAGEPLTYTLHLVNHGPSAAGGVEVRDSLPTALQVVSVTPAPACTVSGQTVICSFGTLAADEERTVIIGTTVRPFVSGTVANEAQATTTTTRPGPATAHAATIVQRLADLALSKSATPAAVRAGEAVRFQLDVVNQGAAIAAGVVATDTLPAGLAFVPAGSSPTCEAVGQQLTCPVGIMAPGERRTLDIVAAVDPGYAANSATNAAVVAADTADPNPTNNAANASVTVTSAADVSVTKTDAPDPATAGGALTYTLAVHNAGPSTARAVTLDDGLPEALLDEAVEPASSCTVAAGAVSCAFGDLAPGETRTVRISGTIHPAFSGTLSNSARAATTTPDVDPANDTATAETAVTARADVSVEKTAAPSPVRAGEPVTWTLRVRNAGPSTADAVRLTDGLPEGIAGVSAIPAGDCDLPGPTVNCTLGDMAPGTERLVTITATVDAARTEALRNAVEVGSDTPDADPGNNAASTLTEVVQAADLELAKTTSDPLPTAGQEVTWTLTATNRGPSVARDVGLVDELPPGLSAVASRPDATCSELSSGALSCALGDLAPGESRQIEIDARIAPQARGELVNLARLSSATPDPDPSDDLAEAAIVVGGLADLRVTKTDSPDPVVAGQPLTYTVRILNSGPSTADLVQLSDRVPVDLVADTIEATAPCTVVDRDVGCGLGTMAPGEERVLTISGQVDPASVGPISNTARVGAETPDPNSFNNTDTAESNTGIAADLAVTKSASGPAQAGRPLSYTVTLTNHGPSVSAASTVTDTLPAGYEVETVEPASLCTHIDRTVGCDFGALAPDESRVVTVVGRVAAGAAGDLRNVAEAGSLTDDPQSANDVASVTSPIDAQADLSVTKTATPDPAVPGAAIAYELTVANAGPAVARAVRMTDAMPPAVAAGELPPGCSVTAGITCVLGDLDPGEQRTIRLAGAVDPAFSGTLANTATVATDTADPVAGNDAASLDVPVAPAANLAIVKRQAPAVVIAGDEVEYTLDVVNRGPSTAANVVIADALDPGLTFLEAIPGAPVCAAALQLVRCTLAALAPGETASVRLRARASAGLVGMLANTGSVTSETPDSDARDNQSTVSSPVGAGADVRLTKSAAPDPVTAGETVTWTLAAINDGPSDARDVTVTDRLPSGVGPAAADRPECHVAGDELTCAFGTLAVGDTRVITVTAPVAAGTGGPLTNAARVRTSTPDPEPGNDAASASVAVDARADLVVTKSAPPAATAGEALTYAIELRNGGPSSARGARLEDALPAGFVVDSVDPAACREEGDALRCAFGDLGPGATRAVTISGRVDPGFRGTLANTARALSDTRDPDAGNSVASASTAVSALADVRVSKRASPAEAHAGEPIAYVVTVENAGLSTAESVVLADSVPSAVELDAMPAGCSRTGTDVSCAVGALAPGEKTVITLSGVIAPEFTGPLANTARATTLTPDADPSNDADTVTTPVSAVADLRLTKTAQPSSMLLGGTATFILRAENRGPSTATALKLEDRLSAVLGLVSVTSDRFSCSGGVSCELPALAPGQSAEVRIEVRPTEAARASTVTNVAELRSETTERNPGDEIASAGLAVRSDADLALTKRMEPGRPQQGGRVAFVLEVRNNGPSDATDVALRDPLPATLVSPTTSVTAGTGACSIAVLIVSCDFPLLPSGDIVAVRIETDVLGSTAATLLANTASVTAAEPDSATANNFATAQALIGPAADLALELAAAPSVEGGGLLTYTARVRNLGPDPDSAVTLRLAMPAGVAVLSAPPGCAADAGGVGCTIGDLPADGTERAVVVVVRVPAALAGAELTGSAEARGALPEPTLANNAAAVVTRVAASPPAGSPGTPGPPPAECLANTLRLVDISPLGGRVRLAGETTPANAGRTVTFEFAGRRVATATIGGDGTFRATVPLPPRTIRFTNRARYRAVLGSLRSPSYKYARRLLLTRLTSRGGKVTLSGRVTGPRNLLAGTVTVRQSADCAGRSFRVAARRVKVSRTGRFRVTVDAPAGLDVVYYRALTRLRRAPGSPRTFRTFTLLRGVRIAR